METVFSPVTVATVEISEEEERSGNHDSLSAKGKPSERTQSFVLHHTSEKQKEKVFKTSNHKESATQTRSGPEERATVAREGGGGGLRFGRRVHASSQITVSTTNVFSK